MESRLRVVRVMRPLEFLRRQIAQGGVPPDAVVKRFKVLEDARLGFLTGRVALVIHQFALQAGEETLDRRVVPALRYPTHATGDPVFYQETLVMFTGVLATPIRVRQQPLLG